MVYIFCSLFDLRERVLMLVTSRKETIFTGELLKQDYRYHEIRKAFSKFYHRDPELLV